MLAQLTNNELSDILNVAEQSISTAFRIYNFVKSGAARKEYSNLLSSTKNDIFVFRGNIYDMSYFWKSPTLPLSEIEALPENIKIAVKNNFNSLAEKGYITLSADKTALECTESGAELCNSHNFIAEACRNRMDVCNDIKTVVKQEQEKRKMQHAAVGQAAPKPAEVPNTPVINYNDNLVNNTSEIVAEAGKKGGKEIAQRTTQEAAKQGAKATVSTAAGVSTAGVATAAQISYELASGGLKIIKNNIVRQ